jgi:hypothetical protein
MPSIAATQQAVREPLSHAPEDQEAFAVYIIERANEIDREAVLAKKLLAQREDSSSSAHVRARSNPADCLA